jgi:DNA-binding transcriptional regulator PaaX
MPTGIYTKKLLKLLNRESDAKRKLSPFYYHYPTLRLFRRLTKSAYYSILDQMGKSGSIEIINRNGERFVKITSKGQLELLVEKARAPLKGKWDGKWRLVLFDIPIAANKSRDKLRRLLKSNNFYKLQGSVFISPYPLNREAIIYLKATGLIEFIRILRVDEFDDDSKLKKHFKL